MGNWCWFFEGDGEVGSCVKVVGTDEKRIYQAVKTLLYDGNAYDKMAKVVNSYGDGHACRRIGEILSEMIYNDAP